MFLSFKKEISLVSFSSLIFSLSFTFSSLSYLVFFDSVLVRGRGKDEVDCLERRKIGEKEDSRKEKG